MPQIQVEEKFDGGSVTSIVDAASLEDLKRTLAQRGAVDFQLRFRVGDREGVHRATTPDALTPGDFEWLALPTGSEVRWIRTQLRRRP